LSNIDSTKSGRPRHYPGLPLEGFAAAEVGYHAAHLAEFRERVYDQIDDLSLDAINFTAPASTLSIGWLAVHLVGGELRWMSRLSGVPIPETIKKDENFARMTPYGQPPNTFGSADELVAFGQRTFAEFTVPLIRGLPGLSAPTSEGPLKTIGEVLRHLQWHWTYHSGQIGLIRLQWGSEYDWSFAQSAK